MVDNTKSIEETYVDYDYEMRKLLRKTYDKGFEAGQKEKISKKIASKEAYKVGFDAGYKQAYGEAFDEARRTICKMQRVFELYTKRGAEGNLIDNAFEAYEAEKKKGVSDDGT